MDEKPSRSRPADFTTNKNVDLPKLEEEVLKQRLFQRKSLKADAENTIDFFLPSAEESYDFFTSTWPEDLSSPVKSLSSQRNVAESSSPGTSGKAFKGDWVSQGPSTSRESSKSAIEEPKPEKEAERFLQKDKTENGEKERFSMYDLLDADSYWQLVDFVPAVYQPRRETLELEKTKIFVPSTDAVPLRDKLPEDAVVRNLADEGFYVGRTLCVTTRNRNKMERRLIANSELQWFGEDGQIRALPDPVSDVSYRPLCDECDSPDLIPIYQKPLLVDGGSVVLSRLDSSTRSFQLDLNVGEVVFVHHYLFSEENVLASKLTMLYRQFCDRKQHSNVEFLSKRLEVIRSSLANVREARHSVREESITPKRNLAQRFQDYRREVRLLRQQLDQEERTDRAILRAILRTWRTLKSLRDRQGYSNTSVHLQIIKKETDKTLDQEAWDRAIEAEVQEEYEDFEAKRQELLQEYNARLDEWNAVKLRNAKRRQKAKKRGEELNDEDESDNNTEIVEPDLPPSFDHQATRERILKKALQNRRRPGEPLLTPELLNSNSVTSEENCPNGERKRRKECAKCKVFVKVLFNDKSVSQTMTKSLGLDFAVTFGEIFNLRVVQGPCSITLQIYEVSGLNTSLIADVFVPVSTTNIDEPGLAKSTYLDDHEFSCDRVVSRKYEAVGSGHPVLSVLSDALDKPEVLFITGIVRCKAYWGEDISGTPLEAQLDAGANGRSRHGVTDISSFTDPLRLKHLLSNMTIDPNDPSNSNLIQYLNTGVFTQTGRNYFRLEQLQEEFNFVKSDEFFNSRRFRMIRLRDEGVAEFRNCRMIPFEEKDIKADAFQAYENRIRQEGLPPEAEDDVDSYRQKCTNYLHKVREEVWKRYRYGKRQKELEDVIAEDRIPDIKSLGSTLVQWTERTRPLRPLRRERKKITTHGVGGTSVSILVNVANAFNVPVRKEAERSARHGLVRQPTVTSIGTIQEIQPLVRPFVEVTVQHSTVRTSASSGPNPCWNQDFRLDFRAHDDNYTPANLQTVRDVVYFNLFDEVVVDILQDERDRDSHVHQRIEKRFLGSLQVPFSTLYLNTRVEGTFKLSTPPLLLGYNRSFSSQQTSIFIPHQSFAPLEKDATYLSVFMTLEPVLPLPEPLKEKIESSESEELLLKAETFRKSFDFVPKREVKTTVIYVNGKSVFVTRFLRELEPPQELLESSRDNMMETIARFVSLIPVVSDVVIFPGICDIWTTNDQFLGMLVGDQEEHAVLLCNYFLYLKKKAWLMLGFAVPDGPSIYVLTHDGIDYCVWNACTGENFSVQDSFCPVQSVGCIIDQDNIWVNVQPVSQPSRMSFDIHNTKNWRPFFDSRYPNPGLASIQPEKLTYIKTKSTFVDQLRDRIEVELRNMMMLWRKRFRTSWNRHCGRVLQNILAKMEPSRFGAFNEDEIQADLHPILNAYKMCGFPLSMPYSELSAIWETVYATGVYLAEGPNVEFALAVHVHPYPHNVVAIWIYVASLHKR